MKPGDVVDVPGLGVRFEFRVTGADTGGEYCEFDVIGRPRGFLRQRHVHAVQHERIEVISGSLRVGGRVLRAGEAIDLPAGTAHSQTPVGGGRGHVRVTHRPAGRTEDFVAALGDLEVNRLGLPTPLSAARFMRDFGDLTHPAHPSPRVQRAVAGALLRAFREYTFVDEWDVGAPPEAVWDTLADGRTYPDWWRPVYVSVEADEGPPAVGHESRQHFKGRLPYHLHTRTRTVSLERPHRIEGETDGDLRGHGVWTLTPLAGGGTHIRFDWRVHADRPLLRALTPVLRPLLRWNHAWAIARARDGLEPYLQARNAAA